MPRASIGLTARPASSDTAAAIAERRAKPLDLVSIKTDTHPLDALFYQPDRGASAGAVLLMHGNCKNFYTGPSRFLPPVLTRLGLACLAYNRRGHDVVVTLNSREAGGGAYQSTAQAIADNRVAAAWLAARGFASPIVIGHSNGGMLAVRHVAHHPETPALVLLSAHAGGRDIVRMIGEIGLLAGDRGAEIAAHARALVEAGRGRELMMLPGWWYLATAESFLDFSTNLPDIVELAPHIHCPVLYLRGDKELAHIYPAEAFAARARACEVRIVPDCDHFYTGREDAVADLIGSWLAAHAVPRLAAASS
jgi:pimeloyl-ACP methyl ester carboxylesterase